jgi:hypothetical protein
VPTRILSTDLEPGHRIRHGRTHRTVQHVTVRHGWSGPLHVVVDFTEGRPEIYTPTARLWKEPQ